MAATQSPADILSTLKAQMPWLEELGLSVEWLRDTAVEVGTNPDILTFRLRQTPEYKARFPALFRQDGSLRMSEAQYLSTENQYRQLLRQNGFDPSLYEQPQALRGLFEAELSPTELNERLDVYQQVKAGSQAVKDAFYVYAGLDVTDDDLFEAALDPRTANVLSEQYRTATANGLTYEDFIYRTSDLVSKSRQMSKAEAAQLLDLLYTGGDASRPQPALSLQELRSAFEEATIGAAASAAGFTLPTKERIAELRQAGVTRAQAQQQYSFFANRGKALSASAERAGLGAVDQSRFEAGVFLGDADAQRAMQTSIAYDEAQGEAGGGFRFDQQGGRLTQRGLK